MSQQLERMFNPGSSDTERPEGRFFFSMRKLKDYLSSQSVENARISGRV